MRKIKSLFKQLAAGLLLAVMALFLLGLALLGLAANLGVRWTVAL